MIYRSLWLTLMLGTTAPAAARLGDCMAYLKKGLVRIKRWDDDQIWRRLYPGLPHPRELAAFRERLDTDTGNVRRSFEDLRVGSFKTHLALREINRLMPEVERAFPLVTDPQSFASWRALDQKTRLNFYFCYLFELFHHPEHRAALHAHPAELIRRAAVTHDLADATLERSPRARCAYFGREIDVESILIERASAH